MKWPAFVIALVAAFAASAADTRMASRYGDPTLVQAWETLDNNCHKSNGSCTRMLYGPGGYNAFTITFWLRLEHARFGFEDGQDGIAEYALPHVWMMFCCDDGRPTIHGGPKIKAVLAKTGTGNFSGNLGNTVNTENFATSFYAANVTCSEPMTLTVGDEDFNIPATNKWIRNIKPNVDNADVSISGGGTYDFAIGVNPCHKFHGTDLDPSNTGTMLEGQNNIVSNEWTHCTLRAKLDGTTCTMNITLDNWTGRHQTYTMTREETDFSRFQYGHLIKFGVFGQMGAYATEHDVYWQWWNLRFFGGWLPDGLVDQFYWRDRAQMQTLNIGGFWTDDN